jgi:hypothetical protein
MAKNINTEQKIVCKLRVNFGSTAIYPHCPKAKAFLSLVNKKTLSAADLYDIAFLGFRIDFIGIEATAYEEYNQTGFVGFQKFLDDWNE